MSNTYKINKLEKYLKKANHKIEINRMIHELELEKLNDHWAEKFSLYVDMMEAQINQDIEIEPNVFRPQTLNEFRKWFQEWTEDINSLNANDDDVDERMADVIQKHGFQFVKKKPQLKISPREIVGARR